MTLRNEYLANIVGNMRNNFKKKIWVFGKREKMLVTSAFNGPEEETFKKIVGICSYHYLFFPLFSSLSYQVLIHID